jgi:universal stress protein A
MQPRNVPRLRTPGRGRGPNDVTKRQPGLRASGSTFRRILVPTDLTSRTERALDLALELAGGTKPVVTLLHVIQTVPGLSFSELKPFYRTLEHKANAKMAALARAAPKAAAEIRREVAYGARAESIVSFASTHRVDLIVLASHRVNPTMAGRDWGTISYKVGILAPCPVLLVK